MNSLWTSPNYLKRSGKNTLILMKPTKIMHVSSKKHKLLKVFPLSKDVIPIQKGPETTRNAIIMPHPYVLTWRIENRAKYTNPNTIIL